METIFNMAWAMIKTWAMAQGCTADPTVREWVHHYFFGGGSEKALPEKYWEETKKMVIYSLRAVMNNPSWSTGATEPADHKTAPGAPEWLQWFCGLQGVVGQFNFSINEVLDEGLSVFCWDTWDFNPGAGGAYIQIPKVPGVKHWAERLGVSLEDKGKEWRVYEGDLSILNPGRAFTTRWEVFIPWEALGVSPEEGILLYDWGGNPGLPFEWLENRALERKARTLLFPPSQREGVWLDDDDGSLKYGSRILWSAENLKALILRAEKAEAIKRRDAAIVEARMRGETYVYGKS